MSLMIWKTPEPPSEEAVVAISTSYFSSVLPSPSSISIVIEDQTCEFNLLSKFELKSVGGGEKKKNDG